THRQQTDAAPASASGRAGAEALGEPLALENRLTQPAARMREQQIDASRLARQGVLQHAAVGLGGLRLAEKPLEVADIAVDRHAEIGLTLVAARNLVERRLALDRVDVSARPPPPAGTQ